MSWCLGIGVVLTIVGFYCFYAAANADADADLDGVLAGSILILGSGAVLTTLSGAVMLYRWLA